MNYQAAGNLSYDTLLGKANFNDANRLLNTGNPRAQRDYAQSNVTIFEKEGKPAEAANAYRQLGNSLFLEDNKKEAIDNYKKAIEKSENTGEISELSKAISDAYVAEDNVDAAIRNSEAILDKAKADQNTELQILQLQDLARLYLSDQQPDKTGQLLEEAYMLAFRSGNTSRAKDCLLALTDYYKRQRKDAVAISRYDSFLHNLDSLIRTDSSW